MARRPPDRSVLDEIRKLRANLAPNQFQPLHNGLGIGRVRPTMPRGSVAMPPPPPARDHAIPDTLPPLPMEALQTPPLPKSAPVVPEVASPFVERPSPVTAKPAKVKKPPGRFMKRASVWGIDATVVVITLLAGMMAIELYAGAGRAALVLKNLPRTLPFMVVRELGPLRTGVGIAIVIVFYWLFFRVFAGGTPGEFLVGARGTGKAKEA